MSKSYIFLDTNIYLHFTMFDEIDWKSICDAEEIVILLPPITVRELDKQKNNHHTPRVRDRARKVIRKLEDLLNCHQDANAHSGVIIEVIQNEPKLDFGEYSLDKQVQDDVLLAHLLEHSEYEPILVANDLGIILKAKGRRLRTMKLAENNLLAEQATGLEKENEELRRVVKALRDKQPEPYLKFIDGNPFAKFTLTEREDLSKVKARNLQQVEKRIPKLTDSDLICNEQVRKFLSPDEIRSFNNRRKDFLEDYENYLNEVITLYELDGRTISLELMMINGGSVPAEDVCVFFSFVDNPHLYWPITRECPLRPPVPPALPKTPPGVHDPFKVPEGELRLDLHPDPDEIVVKTISPEDCKKPITQFDKVKHGWEYKFCQKLIFPTKKYCKVI